MMDAIGPGSQHHRNWRRKTGVITLVMACVITIAWARSIGTMDVLTRTNDGSREWIASLDGDLSFTRLAADGFAPEPEMFLLFGDGYASTTGDDDHFGPECIEPIAVNLS